MDNFLLPKNTTLQKIKNIFAVIMDKYNRTYY